MPHTPLDESIAVRMQRTFDDVAARSAANAPGLRAPQRHLRARTALGGTLALAVAAGIAGGLLLRHPFGTHNAAPAGTAHPAVTHSPAPTAAPTPLSFPSALGPGAVAAPGPDGNDVVVVGAPFADPGSPPPATQTWRYDGSWHRLDLPRQPTWEGDSLLVRDDARRQDVLLTFDFGATTTRIETWVFDGAGWRQLHPRHMPRNRAFGQPAAYDPVHRTVLMLDGDGGTWTWDGADWTVHNGAGWPQAAGGGALAWDPGSRTMVLFSQEPVNTPHSPGEEVGNLITTPQTWAWNGRTWTRLHPRTQPDIAGGPVGVASDDGGVLVVFGGGGPKDGPQPVIVWRWHAGQWSHVITPQTGSAAGPGFVDALMDMADGTVLALDLSGHTYGDAPLYRWTGAGWSAAT